MTISQGPHHIDDTLAFTVTTHTPSTGAAADADAVPDYRIYEDETSTAILTGSMAKLDDANTLGFYSEQITLSAANGFEVGKTYNIYVTAAVGSVTGTISAGFKVHAPIATQASVDTVDDFLDTEIAAIKAKTDNLPADPADASDIAASFSTVNSTLSTIAGYIDTEVAAILADTNELQTDFADGGRIDLLIDAIKAKTDNLPAAPAATGDIPTVATIADAVWEEAIADHSGTAGSTAEALGAAGSAGDPWTTALPGAYSSGQAGYIVGTNLNATVSSRATQTSVDTIDGIVDTILADTAELQTDLTDGGRLDLLVDAIKVKTDNLPTDPADASDVAAAVAALNDLSASDIRTAIGLASANLDTQLADLPTNAELSTALGTADDAVLAAIADVPTVSEFNARTLASADYATASDLAAANTSISNANTTLLAAVGDVPTNTEFNARTLAAADYATATNLAAANTSIANANSTLHSAISGVSGANATAVADAVWDEALSGHTTSGTAGQILGNLTLAAIADSVWDEATSGHSTIGTTGKALSDAGSAGDPWETSIGNGSAYSEGQAGQLLSKLRTEVANATVIVLPNDPIEDDLCHLYGQLVLPNGRLASAISLKLELSSTIPIKLDSGRPVAYREIIARTDTDGYIVSTAANGTVVQYQPIARTDKLSVGNATWSITSDDLKFAQESFYANGTTLDIATLI